jgi:hypothetical protein
MPSPTYPTRQPITNANLAAFLAAHPPRRTARVIVTEKPSEAMIERMAADMRAFGEGMTRVDLKRIYTDRQIDACAEEAARRARARAGFN